MREAINQGVDEGTADRRPGLATRCSRPDVKRIRLTRRRRPRGERPGAHPGSAAPHDRLDDPDRSDADPPGTGRGHRRRCAYAARRQGLAVPLRRAVLPAVRRLRALPAALHRLGLAAPTGTCSATTTWSGWRTTPSCSHDAVLLERAGQHRRHLRAVHRPAAAARLVVAHLLNRRLRGRTSSGWACCCPTSPRWSRSPSSSPSSSAMTSASSTGCSAWSASTRSTGRRARCRSGSRSPRWSTGGGPATTP